MGLELDNVFFAELSHPGEVSESDPGRIAKFTVRMTVKYILHVLVILILWSCDGQRPCVNNPRKSVAQSDQQFEKIEELATNHGRNAGEEQLRKLAESLLSGLFVIEDGW